jgi:hypothetical protein
MSKFKKFESPRKDRITFRLAIRRNNQWFAIGRNNVVIDQQTYVCCFEIKAESFNNLEIISFREVVSKKEFLAETLETYEKCKYFNRRTDEVEVFDFNKDSTLCML